MVSVGTVLAIVAAIAVIVLLYMWPEIFGRTHNEYFTNPPPAAPPAPAAPPTAPAATPQVEKLPIEAMSSANLLQAVAVPHIKSLEGFQSGSVHTSLNDGNGRTNSFAGSNTVVGGGYNIQPMDNSAMSGTAAGSGAPSRLTTYTPPLASVVMQSGPLAGSSAGAGFLMAGGFVPIVGYTSVNSPSPILNGPPLPPPPPPPPSMNLQVLNSGMIRIGDVQTGSYAKEDQTSTPSFTVAASQVDQGTINTLKTNIASGGQYMLNVTSDLPTVKYSFPLQAILNVTNSQNQVYAYNFKNQTIVKPGPVFFGAKTLNFQIIQTEPLPQTAPNSTPRLPTIQPVPTPVASGSSIHNNSSGTSGAPGRNVESSYASSASIAQPATQVSSQMMNTLAVKLINALITNETDPTIKVGLMTALQNVPKTDSTIPDPGYINVYNAVAAIPTNFTYTQLANMYNTLPSTTGTTRPVPNPANVVSMAPVVGAALQATRGQVNTTQGLVLSRWDTQPAQQQTQQQIQQQRAPASSSGLWAPTPPNAISSEPPSTMASILPATAQVSPINSYTFTNQSIMLDASSLAQKIRSAELMIKCNNYSPLMPPVASSTGTAPFAFTDDSYDTYIKEMMLYYQSQSTVYSSPITQTQMETAQRGLLANLIAKGIIPTGITIEQIQEAERVFNKQKYAKANDKRFREEAAVDKPSQLFIDTNGLAIGILSSKNGECTGSDDPASTLAYEQCNAALIAK